MNQWKTLLEMKNMGLLPIQLTDLDPFVLRERFDQASQTEMLELYASHQLIKDIYVSRPQIETKCTNWLQSKSPLLLLKAEAGGGKTSLLVHQTTTWSQQGNCVLFTRALYYTEY